MESPAKYRLITARLEYRSRRVYRLVSSGLCRRQICIYDPLLACHPCKSKAGITVPYRQSIYRIQIVNRY